MIIDGPTMAAREAISLLGNHLRDRTTGIAGRVVGICFYEHVAPQVQLRRYGVASNGAPYEQLWCYLGDCETISADQARE